MNKQTMKTTPKKKTAVKKEKKTEKGVGLSVPVYDTKGEIEKNLTLPKEIFTVKVNPKLLAQVVRIYLINQRQGNASTKTRSEVTGSTRKIYRQKGTGRARHGDIKAPIFIGGGIVGGPRKKKYHAAINKKQKDKAFFGALTLKYKQNDLSILSSKFLEIEPKTKTIANFLEKVKLTKLPDLLIIAPDYKNNLFLAARNIENVSLATVNSLDTYQLMKSHKILIVEKALTGIKNRYHYEN